MITNIFAVLGAAWTVLAIIAAILVCCDTKPKKPREKCDHPYDLLCAKYGCPDDPSWRGDGCS